MTHKCPLCDYETGPLGIPYMGGSKHEEIFLHVYRDHVQHLTAPPWEKMGANWKCPCGFQTNDFAAFVGHVLNRSYPNLFRAAHVRKLMLHLTDALMGVRE